jgi:hypothetical protein
LAITASNLNAVDQMTVLIHGHHAIGIAVVRDADIGAQFPHLVAQPVGFGRTAVLVDIEAVRIDANRDDFGAEPPQRSGITLGGSIRATDNDPQLSSDKLRGKGRLANSIYRSGTPSMRLARPSAADSSSFFARSLPLDFEFHLIGVAIRAERLDAIVVVGIVPGRERTRPVCPCPSDCG